MHSEINFKLFKFFLQISVVCCLLLIQIVLKSYKGCSTGINLGRYPSCLIWFLVRIVVSFYVFYWKIPLSAILFIELFLSGKCTLIFGAEGRFFNWIKSFLKQMPFKYYTETRHDGIKSFFKQMTFKYWDQTWWN